jgi:hypothetical protein
MRDNLRLFVKCLIVLWVFVACGQSNTTAEEEGAKGGGTEVVAKVPVIEVAVTDSVAWEFDVEHSPYYNNPEVSEMSAKLRIQDFTLKEGVLHRLFSWEDSLGLHSLYLKKGGELWLDSTLVGSLFSEIVYTWSLRFTDNYASLHFDEANSFQISKSDLKFFRAEGGMDSKWIDLSFKSGLDSLNFYELNSHDWFETDVNVTEELEEDFVLVRDTITLYLSKSEHDAEEDSLGNMDLISMDLDLLTDFSVPVDLRAVGLYFEKAGLPRGAKIHQASLRVVAQDPGTLDTKIRVCSEWNGMSLAFGSSPKNISSRKLSFDCLTWLPESWVSGEVRYVNLRSPAQNAVMHTDWNESSGLTFIFEGYGSRDMVSFDRSPIESPRLTVIYSK